MRIRPVFALVVLALCIEPIGRLSAQDGTELASARLQIQGAQLSIFQDGVVGVDDADQVLNVAEPGRVRTCYGGVNDACGTIQAGDPRVAGLVVRGELSGPELPTPRTIETVPGGSFHLPGFQVAGTYILQNIRLVEVETERVVGYSQPSFALLDVHQIVVMSASVSQLSLEDLRERGIELGRENFQAFNFLVGFAIDDQVVEFEMPILFEDGGIVEQLDSPTVAVNELPPDTIAIVERWIPPNIVPFALRSPTDHWEEPGAGGGGPLGFPLFGAIVMPGTVTFLNQFFDAQLVVANGAPADSGVQLSDLEATLALPSGHSLRLHGSVPATSPGLPVPVVDAGTQDPIIDAASQGVASWTLEGMEAGTHVVAMTVDGRILRPGRDPLPVTSRVQAAVDVVDPRFHFTFAHPDVVREGFEYSLFVTVANRSAATQNLITLNLREESITGAHKADPDDDFVRTIESIPPGGSETVEYALVADLTGEVVAATFVADGSVASGSFELYTGVGDLGIPLSPATLQLPRHSERLSQPWMSDDGFWVAFMRFLGLAYSLAVAPPSMTPDGLPTVVPDDVEAVAVDAGYAGQRTYLRDTNLRSLEVLILDLLGNREDRAGVDELRRVSDKGRAMGAALGELLRAEQAAEGLSAVDLWDHYLDTVSYTAPHVAAMVRPAGGLEAPVLEIRREVEGAMTYLAYPSDHPEALRSLPFGEVLAVSESAGGVPKVPMALVGRVGEEILDLRLHNTTSETASGRLTALVPSVSGLYREVDTGIVEIPAGAVWSLAVSAATPDSALVLKDAFSGAEIDLPVSISVRTVDLPPFRLIGTRRDLDPETQTTGTTFSRTEPPNRNRDLFGTSLSFLFNRPPDRASAEQHEHYALSHTFDGFDTEDEPVHLSGSINATTAFHQPSGRVVIVRYSQPLNPMRTVDDTGPLVVHTHQIQTAEIVDRWGTPLEPDVPEPEPSLGYDQVGSLLAGRVFRGNGEGVGGATIQLIRTCLEPPWFRLELAGETLTSADGEYFFEFAERDHPTYCITDTATLRALIPAGDDPAAEPATVEEVSTTLRRDGLLTRINIALLGRGSLSGRLVWADSGAPVEDGEVTAASAVFGGADSKEVADDGSFSFGGVPVGPVTVAGRGPEGERVYATVEIRGPGDHQDVTLRLPRDEVPATGTVSARVFQRSGEDPDAPPDFVAGAEVAVYSRGDLVAIGETNPMGFFFAEEVPEGPITVQAALWEVSRSSAIADTILVAGTTAEVELTLVASETRSVSGRVLYHDPASNTDVPIAGVPVFISGPGVSTFTDDQGRYRLDGVPTQGITDPGYLVESIDYSRGLSAAVHLPPIVDSSPDVVLAGDLVLKERRTAIRGLVLDPLANPAPGVAVEFVVAGYWYTTAVTGADGRFFVDDLPAKSEWSVVAHKGSGLVAPYVGWFDGIDVATFGGLTSFAPLSLRGSGTIQLTVRTESGPLEDAWVFVRRSLYMPTRFKIGVEDDYTQLETDPNGFLTFEAPVGPLEIVVYHPFFGRRDFLTSIGWHGQVRNIEAVFSDAGTVQGQVVDVDGVTPVPGAELLLVTETLLPQPLTADELGRFRYELVPEGIFSVEATATVGTIERHGQGWGVVGSGSTEFDLTVKLEPMGTVRGQVFDDDNGTLTPVPYARVRLIEGDFPWRTFPSEDGWSVSDAEGRFEFGGVSAGEFFVNARHPADGNRMATVKGSLETDWEVVEVDDLVLSTSHGTIEILVRDPETGAPLADCPITLTDTKFYTDAFGGVTGADGRVEFIAMALDDYAATAFHPPSGRTGRKDGLRLDEPLEHLSVVIEVDQRGEIRGVVWDDPAMTIPVALGLVHLDGTTQGGPLRAMASTSMDPATLGAYQFLGIPEGEFDLTATSPNTNRLGRAEVTLSASAPVAEDVNLVLEPVGSVHVRLFERLSSSETELDPATGVFAVQLTLESQLSNRGTAYQFTQVAPTGPYPGHWYQFDEVLLDHEGTVTVQEMSGQRRTAVVTLEAEDLQAAQSPASPVSVVLHPMGVVRVTVIDENAQPIPGADVVLTPDRGETQPLRADDLGQATYTAVPGGPFTVTAQGGESGWGGRANGVIANDDDVLDFVIQLQAAHSIEGRIVEPSLGDAAALDPSTWVPVAGALVSLSHPVTQVMLTDDEGFFRFDALPGASYAVSATHPARDGRGSAEGSFSGPVTDLGAIVLDVDIPRLISVAPPNGMERVSRSARVDLTFSEPLAEQWLREDGTVDIGGFDITRADGSKPPGSWSWSLSAGGLPVVTFTPSQPYASDELYSVKVSRFVSDRSGRQLGADIGSSFRTADTEGPEVLGTVPDLARPFAEEHILRIDFNEALYAASDDPLVVAAAGAVEWLNDLGEWSELPLAAYFTREHYSFAIDPLWEGFELTGDTLVRRVTVRDLADHDDNTMTVWSSVFRMRDENAPSIDDLAMLPDPVGGAIDAGTPVVITPQISGVDAFTWIGGAIDPPLPQGDVDRVEYFFSEPLEGAPADVTVAAHPWSLEFVAAYVGDGVTPRQLSVWCRAVDTSTNISNVQRLDLEIHPNQTPEISSVVAEATAPVAGVFFAGSTVAATVHGLADADGAQLSLWAELRLDDGTFVDSTPVIAVERPISGVWAELPPPVLQLVLPLDVPEGAVFRVHVTAADSLGAEITVPSGDLTVADDTEPPLLSDLVARHVSTGETDTRFTIGEAFTLEARIADLQTAVAQARIVLDRTDIFPEPVSMTRVGVSDVYRSDELVVPVDGVTDAVTVTATFEADDHGGNTGVAAMPFEVAPEDDPEIPTVEWLTPWHGAPWPADHQSVVAPGDGVALALTVRVEDRTLDGETPVPGEIAVVEIRGPVIAAGGGVELAATPVTPTVVPGTASPGAGDFQTIWRIPDSIPAGTALPFEVRAVDTGGHSVVRTIEMVAVESRHVYEAVNTAVVSDDDMTAPSGSADGTVFLLDGARLAVYPRDDDQPREISGLAVYAGGQPQTGAAFASVLSAPEVSSSASSVLFHPLNLRVTGTLAVGYGSSIDVSGDGLLGCDESGCVTLPGGSAAGDAAGGSHGGLGWFGSPNRGWDRSDLTQSAPSYGSLRAPMLPGGGGGAHGVFAGGRGGGVLRIDAEDAVVHLAGSLFANGRTGDAGGGAGGSIWINARELRGHGAIAALGASGADANRDGGGSGGRISVLVDGPADAEGIAARCTASGAGRGGAGTVYVETVAPGAEASGIGLLKLSQSEAGAATALPAVIEASVAQVRPDDRVIVAGEAAHGDPSGSLLVVRSAGGVVAILPIERMQGATEIVVAAETAELQALADLLSSGEEVKAHSREHLSSLAAEGPVRLVTDAELAIGPDAPVLDDRSALDLTDGARVRLRDEAPAFTITATPLPDTDVRVGSTVNATWSVSDPLGVWMVEHQWPFDGGPRFVPYAAAPVDVVDDAGSFPISATATPGPVVLESTYTTIDGRVVGSVLQWTVLDNAQPTITLAIADGAPSAIHTGATTQLFAHAEDLEGLAAIRFAVSGPSSTPSRDFTVSGLVVDQVFDVTALMTADGTEPIVVAAEVEDISGAVVASAGVSIDVIADTSEPVISIDLAPVEAGDLYVSGQPVTITVSATDDTDVSDLSAVFDGVTRTSSGQTIQWDWIAPFVVSTTEFLIEAEGHDPSGNLGVAQRTIIVEPSDNPNAPVVRYDCAADRRSVVVGFETAVAVTLTDDDDIDTYRVLIDGVPLGDPVTVQASSLSTTVLWTPPGDAEAGTTYLMTVEATDFAGNVGAASTFLEVIAGDLLDESGTLVGSQTTGRDLILSSGTFTADGTIMPNSLTLISGATLTTPVGVPLTILADQVTVGCNAALDVSGRGYRENETYPGEPHDPTDGSGSHMGVGGGNEEEESTYGSVTRPQEMGAGGKSGFRDLFGGGAIRIEAGSLRVDGSILANGVGGSFDGAGGSVWVTVDGELNGDGQIRANGGSNNSYTEGGGGAVSLEYGSSSGSVLDNVMARGGYNLNEWNAGGAGTVYLYQQGVSTYGDLIVDNGTVVGRPTRLPALGVGTAATGSSGAVLETGLASIQPYFEGHWVEVTDGATGTLRGTWRITGIADGTVTLGANAEDGDPIVVEGDTWQGVHRFDTMTVAGTIPLRSDDPIRVAEQTITGVVETTHISADRLVVASGGKLTSPRGWPLDIDVSGEVVVEAGASIDVSGRGYRENETYPGEPHDPTDGSGSHMGVGGGNEEEESTYGSVTRPQEMGAGGKSGFRDLFGGGAIRIEAGSLRVDGSILANGVGGSFDGAGGSVWVTVDGELNGDGQIRANGGSNNSYTEGGGGAVSLEYGSSSGSVLDNVMARGGYNLNEWNAGGAGTVYLYQQGVSTYGDLIVDNGTVVGRPTRLPALGVGTAATGSSGAVLETGLASIQPYFEGHWVEVTDGATGTLRGTWRIAGIADGTVTLEANAEDGDPIVVEGDTWQGVYRFDGMTVAGKNRLRSDDPIRVGEQTITGVVETDSISADRLVVASGGTLTSPRGSSLVIDVSGEVVVEAGASIDVSGKGYARNQTYPGEPHDPTDGGGSHMGVGGANEEEESTYGSVTRPQEMGAGGKSGSRDLFGGGVVRIDADSLRVDGAIRANGSGDSYDGAGGSVWITVDGELAGDGSIQANGGGNNSYAEGGGGAVSLEFGSSSGSVLDNAVARGGYHNNEWNAGGAGTVYVHQHGVSTYGDLIVDNGTIESSRRTHLPALGSGAAATGSNGAVLETGLASIQPYFEGHWVEITDGSTGTLRGTWRISGIADGTVTLEANAEDGDPIVVEGDTWQGVYRFDGMTVAGKNRLRSDDPIRVGEQTITGVVETDSISADRLVVASGGTLTSPRGSSLVIDVSGEVVVEAGASIDVSGKGYARNQTYPGEPHDPTDGGGSHMGVGGANEEEESTYGSVTRPQEMGAGGKSGSRDLFGGGVVRIDADSLRVDGAIRANGSGDSYDGAGGSVWITVDGELAGDGSIQANGGGNNSYAEGGGGAVSLEFGSSSGSVLDNAVARGGYHNNEWNAGGAGTVYVHQHGVSTYGDLIVDNGTIESSRRTHLPALGSGAAATGSSGAVLETGLVSIQPYFEGHWVEITDGSTGTLRGTWRIAGIAGGTVTLEANAEDGAPIVVEGDTWQGVYRFDSLAVKGNAHLVVPDMDRITGDVTIEPGATAIFANRGGPTVNTGLVSMAAHDGSFWVTGAAGAVTDSDGVATASLRNLRTGDTVAIAVNPDGSFPTVTVAGVSGDELVIDASDAHVWVASSSTSVGSLPANDGAPVLQAARIQVSVIDEATVQVTGAAGAVSDGEGPVQLSVENTTASGTVSTPALADGSFTITIAAAAFDRLSLTATDGHPEPQIATLDLGEVPDVTPPEVVAGVLGIAIHDQHYWLVSGAPAFVDDGGIASAAVFVDGDSASMQPLTLNADASVAESMVVGPENGSLTVVVSDLGGNTIQAALPFGLPANSGPPSIDPERAVVSPAIDRYDLDNEPEHPVASDLIVSSDGVSLAEWSIRSAPFATAVQAIAVDDGNFIDLEPVQIVGAVGDSLWLRVVDDHPFGQETEAEIRQLPEITGAPVVDLGRVVVQGIDGTYRVTGYTNSVIDDDGPISVTVTAWRQTGETWAIADEAAASVDSGASFVTELSAALEGDSVILTVADSAAGGPYVNRYRLGLLPAMTDAPTIDPAKFALDLSGCTPRLVAESGAVTATDETISVEITVEHPDLGELEYNEPFDISSGQAFVADIAEIEPGSEVQVRASAQVATSVVVATAPTAPVVHVDQLELLRFEWGGLRLGVEGPDITDRVNPVEIRLTNLHPDRAATVSATLPCDGGWGEALITAQPGDLLQMEACNGNDAQVCTGPIDLGGTPIGKKRVLDIGGRGVTDLLRRGSGVLISMDDGNGRWLLTTDLWMEHRELTPPRGDVTDVFAPSWWGLGVVDGPAVYYWDNGNGVENTLLPFGEGIDVDAALERQNHLFVAGGDGIDLLFGAVAVDGRDGRIQCAPPSIAVLESGTSARALAVVPLGAARLGVLVDGTTSSGDGPPRMVAVDVSDPWNPVAAGEDTSLVLNPAPMSPIVDARVDQGELVLETATGEFLIYTAVRPWEWAQRASFGSRNGAWPTVATIWGAAAWVGYDNGDVVGYALAEGFNADPPEVAVLVHPSDAVSGIVTGNRALVVGLASGLVAYELEEHAIQPELHASAVRATAHTVSLAAGAAWFGPAGADLRASGTGIDGVGTPTTTSVDLGYIDPRNWWTVSFDLPNDTDGVFDVQWDTLTVVDRGSGYEDSIVLSDAVDGPPFLDVNCHSGVFSCGITTGAAGPGWRASGPDFQHPNWLRYRWTEGNGWNQHGFPSNSDISHIEGLGDVLLAASNELLVADFATIHGPNLVGRTPFGGAPLGPVAFAANGSLAVVSTATGLELAVVDLADPRNPWIVTAAQTVADGLGTVTDLHDDGEGSLWILTAGPDRVHRLDAAQLPNLVLLESMDLDPSGMPVALDTGRFDSEWGTDLAAMFIVRRGVGLEMVDRQSLEFGVLDQIPVSGDARDVFVGDLDGGMRILVAAGYDRGVVEVRWNDSDLSWSEHWLADLGHVRGFAYAADAYRDGQEWPETCQDFSHVDVKSTVPTDGTPRLYAITDAGILHVDTDLRSGGFGAPALTVVPELISLDLSGCQPTLRGLEGAATGNGTLSISAHVDNEASSWGLESWWSDPEPLASGAAFAIPLYSVEAESVVHVTIWPELGSPRTLIVDTINPDRPFEVDASGVEVSFEDGWVTVVTPSDALPWRLQDVRVTVWGDAADGASTHSGECPDDPPYSISFPAVPFDSFWMEVCTGTTEDFCDTELIYQPLKSRPGSSPASE
jgi:hypothetical protein